MHRPDDLTDEALAEWIEALLSVAQRRLAHRDLLISERLAAIDRGELVEALAAARRVGR